MQEIREPKQKRSIEKKNKIIIAGYELFCEKGYYNTNTAEIAKRAGVSTGIVYNYFADKKDIFNSALDYMKENIQTSMLDSLQTFQSDIDLRTAVENIIDITLDIHLSALKIHEEITAMAHLDEDVNNFFKEFEENLIGKLAEILILHGLHIEHPHEKLHIAYNMVENFCHETLYHNHACVDEQVMKEIIIDTIVHMIL
ncbi:TetR/AcrR family transcriptional regulator [Konateibacter massiliensis]|uniref:TetR/AcrR family transcriptional regulator n=1 Tax=Konateibacter massiliensis TaxID=2002841 RepID=UPI0015D4A454|nr:TetR/AcrR family transcriptional regulator [Konateibacter massiliensis]